MIFTVFLLSFAALSLSAPAPDTTIPDQTLPSAFDPTTYPGLAALLIGGYYPVSWAIGQKTKAGTVYEIVYKDDYGHQFIVNITVPDEST